jgi:S-adenosylmethionine decarboxylase proenzyme
MMEVSELNTRGRHLLVEYTGCDGSVLDDLKRIEALMNQAAKAARTNIVASVFQPFEPHGVTGVVVVEESHLSIHTWPEHGYAAVDFFTCGESVPEAANRVLGEGLKAERAEVIFVDRGLSTTGPSMRLRSHSTEHFAQRGVGLTHATQTAQPAAQASHATPSHAGNGHNGHNGHAAGVNGAAAAILAAPRS